MKKIIYPLIALALIGCASQKVFKAATQNYRLKNSDSQIVINGAIFQTDKTLSKTHSVGIYFNGHIQIGVDLDNQLNGEASGNDFEGKKTSATCTGRQVTRNAIEVRCMVFIDNEKTVTLTF